MELGYLTEPVRDLLSRYGGGERLMDLDFGGAVDRAPRRVLEEFQAREAFPGALSPEGALSGLWLYFGAMDEAHKICQDLPTADGSFWHGIVHRREPDPSNAAYWFRRVGHHPVFGELLERACQLSAAAPEAGFAPGRRQWDPFAFIDYCEEARLRPGHPSEQLAKEIQLAEWQLLFEHCARSGK
jgi:hypothetical protein